MEISTILTVIGVIILFVIEAFLEVTFLSFLGALVRKIFIGKTQTLKQVYSSKVKLNSIIGFVTLLIFLTIVLGTIAIINN